MDNDQIIKELENQVEMMKEEQLEHHKNLPGDSTVPQSEMIVKLLETIAAYKHR